MKSNDKTRLREFILQSLAGLGDKGAVSDDDSLFASGRLDSLSMTKLVMYLEDACGIDFGDVDFDADLLDSINLIEQFVDAEQSRAVR
ncbi:acyl carrier protein [Variovorax humicola]|uniref:Acyl carrier protein n=1 Tax=Variovorax humicola TaxID=1769758 RepID=A0ABU8VWR4_9BURK